MRLGDVGSIVSTEKVSLRTRTDEEDNTVMALKDEPLLVLAFQVVDRLEFCDTDLLVMTPDGKTGWLWKSCTRTAEVCPWS